MFRRVMMAAVLVIVAFPMVAQAGTGDTCEMWEVTKDYFRDRGNDLLDMFWIQGGACVTPKTGGIHLRLSKYVQLGYVRFEGYKAGNEGRAFMVVKEKKVQRGKVYVCPDTEIVQVPLHIANAEHSKRPVIRNGWYKGDDGREQPWSLNLEAALPSMADVDVGFCPGQVVDFVLGVFFLDPLADDSMENSDDPNSWFENDEVLE